MDVLDLTIIKVFKNNLYLIIINIDRAFIFAYKAKKEVEINKN